MHTYYQHSASGTLLTEVVVVYNLDHFDCASDKSGRSQSYGQSEHFHGADNCNRLFLTAARVLDALNLAIIVHTLYFYMVTSYGNQLVLLDPTWSVLAMLRVSRI